MRFRSLFESEYAVNDRTNPASIEQRPYVPMPTAAVTGRDHLGERRCTVCDRFAGPNIPQSGGWRDVRFIAEFVQCCPELGPAKGLKENIRILPSAFPGGSLDSMS
jgi:hypothetical protein